MIDFCVILLSIHSKCKEYDIELVIYSIYNFIIHEMKQRRNTQKRDFWNRKQIVDLLNNFNAHGHWYMLYGFKALMCAFPLAYRLQRNPWNLDPTESNWKFLRTTCKCNYSQKAICCSFQINYLSCSNKWFAWLCSQSCIL